MTEKLKHYHIKSPPSTNGSSGPSAKDTSKASGKRLQGRDKKKESNKSSFGGFQKGFLSATKPSSSPPASSAASVAKISKVNPVGSKSQGSQEVVDDVIRPKEQSSKLSGLEFPEVQEAMKKSYLSMDPDSEYK